MSSSTQHILIVKLSAIGDVVHTLPALNALRRHFPKAHITWLAEAAAAGLLEGHPALDRLIVSHRQQWARELKTSGRRRTLRQIGQFLTDLRDTRYDMIFDFQAALKGAMLIALARGQRKIGFGPGMQHQEHSYLVLNEKIPMISMEVHALERGLALLEAVGIPTGAIEYRLPISAESHDKVAGLLRQQAFLSGDLFIAINPMAKWESKLWPMDRFSLLADRLIDRYRATICFTGGPQDRDTIDTIRHGMHHASINLAGRTSLIELAALYEQMACVISTDTGPMHIAAAVERPVVALFGPTAEWRTGPHGDRHRVVTASERCRPCFKRKCPELGCMEKISVEHVLQQVDDILT